MSIYGDFQHVKELLESVGCKITLTEHEADKMWQFMDFIQSVVDREKKNMRSRELENIFLDLVAYIKADKRKEAFELIKKLDEKK